MARVTVEDCIDKLDNRFDLVKLAAERARSIGAGAQITVDKDNDKNPVIALREIAAETISVDDLKNNLVKSYQKHIELDDDIDDEIIELISDGSEDAFSNLLGDD